MYNQADKRGVTYFVREWTLFPPAAAAAAVAEDEDEDEEDEKRGLYPRAGSGHILSPRARLVVGRRGVYEGVHGTAGVAVEGVAVYLL